MCTPSASGGLHHDHYEPIALGTRKRENIGDELYAPHRRALVCREYECDQKQQKVRMNPTANAINESAIPTSYIRGILSFMHVILYVLSLTKTGVNITDELVVFQSNDHLYKGSRLAFKHCLPARSKLSYHTTTVWENICFSP